MRILTPSEQREIEQRRRDIINIGSYHTVRMAITPKNYELWLNILDLALRHNDIMRTEWLEQISAGNSTAWDNVPAEVRDKLRPK